MNQAKRALIVIDVQNEYFSGGLRIEYPDVNDSLANICRAIDTANAAGIPVVVVQQVAAENSPIFARGSKGAELHPEIARRPYQHLVQKNKASALTGTDLADWLKTREIDTLTVVGYMTHNCVDATVRQASHSGWKVEVLHDACGSLPYANAMGRATAEEIHRIFCVVMHTGFAALGTTDAWLTALAEDRILTADSVYLSSQRALTSR